jgi:hypothetical protein
VSEVQRDQNRNIVARQRIPVSTASHRHNRRKGLTTHLDIRQCTPTIDIMWSIPTARTLCTGDGASAWAKMHGDGRLTAAIGAHGAARKL